MNELQYQAALDKTLELFKNFSFNVSTKNELTNINGYELPMDYLCFINHYNGGEGAVGENSYMQLLSLEEVLEYNNDYELFSYFPTSFAFGTDLGGNHFCYDFLEKKYFAIDACSMDYEDRYCFADSFFGFIRMWDNELNED